MKYLAGKARKETFDIQTSFTSALTEAQREGRGRAAIQQSLLDFIQLKLDLSLPEASGGLVQ